MGEGSTGEVGANLRQGITEISEAYKPLDTGIRNANTLVMDLDEVNNGVDDILNFLDSFKERTDREVVSRFSNMNDHYQRAAELIASALRGANDNNQHATDARQGATELSVGAQRVMDSLIPISDENVRDLASHLLAARTLLRKMSGAIVNAQGWGRRLPEHHASTSVAVQLYLENL